MKTKHPPIPVIIILVLAVLTAGYFGVRALLANGDGALTASGTIEAVEVTISPEIGGKVVEVFVDEGEAVRAGDRLFRLDDTLLQAQRRVAAANLDLARGAASTADAALESAHSQYDLTADSVRAEAAANRTASWRGTNPSGYTLPGWYYSQQENIVSAQAEVDAANAALGDAQAALGDLLDQSSSADFVAAEKKLVDARATFLVADDVLARAKLAQDNADLQLAAQERYDAARQDLDDAQADYDDLSDRDAAKDILTARAELAAARERYAAAQDRLLALQTGDFSPRLTAAQNALTQAQAAADQATLAVAQAEAQLALLDAQIAKLTVSAPSAGVILTRAIQPGEVVSPGASALTLARLDDLTITVYVPEDRYGEVSLGQSVDVSVDSFPGVTFTAAVTHIADQAEFTPRNVQTAEGRQSTVYAIKLQVQDPEGKLRPGMPADVTFGVER
jgi:HlyD family secretion protein